LPISFWQMRSTERQSAIGLLEAMQENKWLLAILLLNWQTFLIATQNPIEQKEPTSSGRSIVLCWKRLLIPKMDGAHGCSSKLKGSYEKVNQVVSVEQNGHKKRFVKYTWMKKSRNTSLISFLPLDTQKI
jgi:hypothetical protein